MRLYGKLPADDFGKRNVLLSAVLADELPAAPRAFGYGRMFVDWGMLGNDQVGDCAVAGPCHEHMVWTGIGNRGAKSAPFTTAVALEEYSAITGYVPGDPDTDRGTNVSRLMDYRRTTGLLDADGARHKIDLGVRLEPVGGPFAWDEFRRAVHAFGCVAVGTMMPASAQQQFARGEIWSYRAGSPIEGGHYVPAVGSVGADEITVVTWGRRQEVDRSFFEAYVDELWVPLCREAMGTIESALSAVDWDAVEKVARGLGQADA